MGKKTAPKQGRRQTSMAAAANQVVADLKPGDKTTLGTLATKAEAMVTASGGEVRAEAARAAVKGALQSAEMFGLVRLTKPTDIEVERLK